MVLDHRKGVRPQTSYNTRNLPHIVAMVTTAAMFSVRYVMNQQLSMDRPKQLSIMQKISMFLSTGVRIGQGVQAGCTFKKTVLWWALHASFQAFKMVQLSIHPQGYCTSPLEVHNSKL